MSADPLPTETRRSRGRVAVTAEVGIRRAGVRPFRVQAFDVSPTGCKVEVVERPSIGERVWIKFDGLEAIEASVRWTAGHICGVEFSRPLHSAVFERLVNRA